MTVTSETAAAAAALREFALDEELKRRVAGSSELAGVFRRVARRYVSGPQRQDAVGRARAALAAGHRVTVDYMGESARDRLVAETASVEFLALSAELADLPGTTSISLDASHVGSVIDDTLAQENLERLAVATGERGQELVLSMEGEDRVDSVLGLYRWLARRHLHVGVTVQARLDRTPGDLAALLRLPGRIRLVKGAYPTTAGVERDDPALAERFDALARRLIDEGGACSIASHDPTRLDAAVEHLRQASGTGDVVFEFLQGIDDELLKATAARGVQTQEYVVYGVEDWLYVCNRIAEDPSSRLLQAVADLATR